MYNLQTARYAPVAPPEMLQYLADKGALGNYHLLLAHDVVEHLSAYQKMFGDMLANDCNAIIIIDNSVIELGFPVSKEVMQQVRIALPKSIVVMPDVIGNCRETIEMSIAYYKEFRAMDLFIEPPYMVIPQGQTLGEFLECARQLLYHTDIPFTWWGIPKHATFRLGTRHELITEMHNLDPSIKIHLMGFSNFIADDITCAGRDCVEGIDSAVPIRLGMQGKPITLDPCVRRSPRENYWERAKAYPIKEAFYNSSLYNPLTNIRSIRRWLDVIHAPLGD